MFRRSDAAWTSATGRVPKLRPRRKDESTNASEKSPPSSRRLRLSARAMVPLWRERNERDTARVGSGRGQGAKA